MPKQIDKLWQLFQANAALHRPGLKKPLCPICLREIRPPGSIGTAGAKPSIGHVFPSSCGGDDREVVLECEDCNNRFGNSFDLALATQIKSDRFRRKDLSPNEVTKLLARGGQWIRANGHPTESKVRAHPGGGIALELHVDEPYDDLRSGRLSLMLVNPPRIKVIVSIFHSAYLYLFRRLGYEYVLEPSVQSLREDLQWAVALSHVPSDALLKKRFSKYGHGVVPLLKPPQWDDLSVVFNPIEFASFAVFLPASTSHAYLALLPGFGPGTGGLYKRLRSAHGLDIPVQQAVWTAYQSGLADSNGLHKGRDLWHAAITDD